jgi:hypothetical protein
MSLIVLLYVNPDMPLFTSYIQHFLLEFSYYSGVCDLSRADISGSFDQYALLYYTSNARLPTRLALSHRNSISEL